MQFPCTATPCILATSRIFSHEWYRCKSITLIFGFCGYFVLKSSFVYPNLTDPSAFLVGNAMMYFYLKQSFLGLFVSSAFGVFCWPLTIIYAIPLFLFSRNSLNRDQLLITTKLIQLKYFWSGILLFVCLPLFYLRPFERFTELFPSQQLFATFDYITILLGLSIVITLWYLTKGLVLLLNDQGVISSSNWFEGLNSQRLLLTFSLIMLWVIPKLFGSEEGMGHQVAVNDFLLCLFVFPLVKPVIFLVAHFAHFGLVTCFACALYPSIVSAIRKQGMGMIIVTLVTVVLSLNPESRYLSLSTPFILPFIAIAAQKYLQKNKDIWILLICCLAQSRFWLPLTHQDPITQEVVFNGRLHLRGVGPWMSDIDWFVYGFFGVCAYGMIHFLWFRPQKKHAVC